MEKNDVLLKKMEKYIELSEHNKELLLDVLTKRNFIAPSGEISSEEKKRAAYALNMCTVSVSQIIDYNDINILEYEYEAILNNINFEQIPKDEALLKILKQLLDTITYFRIEEGDKQFIEKEYQQKVKNAIWASVPNFGMIVAGGNLATMAISLASQVGIGYMNYRRNKAEYYLDKERQYWALQRSAMEQFNGLRRELFDTAWRLADTYNFPDEYRLTERQITQYNKILMDDNYIRKYERLESIKSNFEAYPPFWYFIGSTANYISNDKSSNLSKDTRKFYRKKALEYFEKYDSLNELCILREDQLAASCALEYVEILLKEESFDLNKITVLLQRAIKLSGGTNDVLQICALIYLKLNDVHNASRYLKILVNEEYNTIINAQLLSSLYIRDHNHAAYEILATRVDSEYLYPMPEDDFIDLKSLDLEFGHKQRYTLKQKYKISAYNLIQKYAGIWNKLTSTFEWNIDYPDEFFEDTDKARQKRIVYSKRIFSDPVKLENYREYLSAANYEIEILKILNNFCVELFDLLQINDISLKNNVINGIKEKLINSSEEINSLQKKINRKEIDRHDYEKIQKFSLKSFVLNAVNECLTCIFKKIDMSNMNEIAYLESSLIMCCTKYKLPEPEIAISGQNNLKNYFAENGEYFTPELFGGQAIVAKKNADQIANMRKYVKDKIEMLTLLDGDTGIYFYGEEGFNGYFYNQIFNKYQEIKPHALMIIKDNTSRKNDLIFTSDGIVDIRNGKMKYLTPYSEVKLKENSIVFYPNREYKNKSFDMNVLYNLIRDLAGRYNSDRKKHEYINETITPRLLNNWFDEHESDITENVGLVYAVSTPKIWENLGYVNHEKDDCTNSLVQFYYEKNTGEILNYRVIFFKSIESNFQALLLENNGVLNVEK